MLPLTLSLSPETSPVPVAWICFWRSCAWTLYVWCPICSMLLYRRRNLAVPWAGCLVLADPSLVVYVDLPLWNNLSLPDPAGWLMSIPGLVRCLLVFHYQQGYCVWTLLLRDQRCALWSWRSRSWVTLLASWARPPLLSCVRTPNYLLLPIGSCAQWPRISYGGWGMAFQKTPEWRRSLLGTLLFARVALNSPSFPAVHWQSDLPT